MQIIPVLDILNRQVVRGIAGRRDEYRPIESKLTNSTAPLDVARALREHFGFALFYLADLDAIQGRVHNRDTYEKLTENGFRLLLDAGIRDMNDADLFADFRLNGIIAGLESLATPDALESLLERFGPERVLFSLDLKDGTPLSEPAAWQTNDPLEIANRTIAMGIRHIIVLDLAHVGTNQGTGTEFLCSQLIKQHPDLKVIAGGGVRGIEDLRRQRENGIFGVLVASALHDGRLTRTVVDQFLE